MKHFDFVDIIHVDVILGMLVLTNRNAGHYITSLAEIVNQLITDVHEPIFI